MCCPVRGWRALGAEESQARIRSLWGGDLEPGSALWAQDPEHQGLPYRGRMLSLGAKEGTQGLCWRSRLGLGKPE